MFWSWFEKVRKSGAFEWVYMDRHIPQCVRCRSSKRVVDLYIYIDKNVRVLSSQKQASYAPRYSVFIATCD